MARDQKTAGETKPMALVGFSLIVELADQDFQISPVWSQKRQAYGLAFLYIRLTDS